MPNEYYSKFIIFLKKHNLYDKEVFKYIEEQSFYIDLLDDNYNELIGGCEIVCWSDKTLYQIIPCMPRLMDDKSVALAIYTYVNAMFLVPKIGKIYKENTINSYLLPMFYEKLYILENPTSVLLSYEENTREKLLKYGSYNFQALLICLDQLVEEYKLKNFNNNKIARRAKRLARNYISNINK